jgi:2,5-diamino-6-(ribosylamino)-4(3H)-pyrimidinone 5'-phosphate reductase
VWVGAEPAFEAGLAGEHTADGTTVRSRPGRRDDRSGLSGAVREDRYRIDGDCVDELMPAVAVRPARATETRFLPALAGSDMYVQVNAATSADGKLSTRRREQVAISGDEDFARVDRLRAEVDAVAVGVGTVLADDPSLVRHDEAHRAAERGDVPPPARVVVDSRGRTPPDASILDGEPTTYLLAADGLAAERERALNAAGATVLRVGDAATSGRVDIGAGLSALADHGVERLLVEGGGELIFSLFDAGLVDRLTVYVGSVVLGGRDAPTLADGEGFVEGFPAPSLASVERLDDGVLLRYDVP